MSARTNGVSWQLAFVILTLAYYYSHYLFASNTAHVSAMYAAFLAAAIASGTPPVFAALVLGFISSLFATLTRYSSGLVPVLFGSGFVQLKAWRRNGLAASVVLVVIWIGVGGAWLKVLGQWWKTAPVRRAWRSRTLGCAQVG